MSFIGPPFKQPCKDLLKFQQSRRGHLWRSQRHGTAYCLITHPRRQSACQPGRRVNVDYLAGLTSHARDERKSPAMQRVPAVFDNDRSNSVCFMRGDSGIG